MGHSITIEMHEHGREVTDLTDYLRDVSWTHSLAAPWTSIALRLHLPQRSHGLFPQVGAWLVLRDNDTAAALAWAFIVTVEGGLRTDRSGVVTADITEVRAVGWLQFLGRPQAFVAPGISQGSVGTLFQIRDWEAAFKAVVSTFEGNLGLSLSRLVRALLHVFLPETLAGEALASAVRVVHDPESSEWYAPRRKVDPVPGLALPSVASAFPTGPSLLSVIQQTFGADDGLIEFFESLEVPGMPPDDQSNETPLEVRRPDPRRSGVTFTSNRSAEERLGLVPKTKAAPRGRRGRIMEDARRDRGRIAGPASDTAYKLGRNPVLVYRMRPWRPVELSTFRTLTNNLRINEDVFDASMFQGTSWSLDDAPIVEADRVKSVRWTFSDDNRVNCVAPGLPSMPDSPIGFWQQSALPLKDDEAILRYGLRVYRPAWPFWPSDAATDRKASFMASLRSLAAQAAQFAAGGERFMAGSVAIGGYCPDVRPGYPVIVELGDVLGGVAPGETLTAYVESVTHHITVDQRGHAMGETSLQYSRGLLDETRRAITGEIGFVQRETPRSTKTRLLPRRLPRAGGGK